MTSNDRIAPLTYTDPRPRSLIALTLTLCISWQTEKQRVIWAYKILFLDVLFPLSLRKVIFVDSDQVIRADFAELWYRDLQVCGLHAWWS